MPRRKKQHVSSPVTSVQWWRSAAMAIMMTTIMMTTMMIPTTCFSWSSMMEVHHHRKGAATRSSRFVNNPTFAIATRHHRTLKQNESDKKKNKAFRLDPLSVGTTSPPSSSSSVGGDASSATVPLLLDLDSASNDAEVEEDGTFAPTALVSQIQYKGQGGNDHTKEKEIDVLDGVEASFSLAKKLNLCTSRIYSNDADTLSSSHRHATSTSSLPLVVGHRGSPFQELENTVEGFRVAAEHCDAVELDVFLLKCGTLVVFHGDGCDQNPGLLHSYCNVDGSILDYTAEEARTVLTFNQRCAEFACPPHSLLDDNKYYIPTLEEILLDAKGTGVHVKIELKGPGTELPALHLVERLNMIDQCSFASFRHERVATIRQHRPELWQDAEDGRGTTHRVKTGCLFNDDVPDNFIELALDAGASEIHLKYDTCTTDRIDAIHSAGLTSMAWFRGPHGMQIDATEKYWDVGNEDWDMYFAVLQTGVMQMCVNKPDLLREMLLAVEKGGMN